MAQQTVSQDFPHRFSNYLLWTASGNGSAPASAPALSVGTTGDILVGIQYTQFRIRKIVARSPLLAGVSGSVAGAAVGLYTAAGAGGTAIAAFGSNTLSNLTTNLTFQELTLAAAAANTIFPAGTYYFNINTAVATGTIELDIYGDVVFNRG
jgi:hypothetical protein